MNRLEQIVSLLERGDVLLADSLALFEEGTKLVSRCSALLDSAEQTVVRLQKGPDGTPQERSLRPS
ncbi:MAG: exodeoxyribonuclease VII small subunit [Oscillospiraceae bacterium]|nr:exodeoxyribonuclease VII small subunit [Oscillospiraceae bacterium]